MTWRKFWTPPPEVEAADPGVEIEKAIYRAAGGWGVRRWRAR